MMRYHGSIISLIIAPCAIRTIWHALSLCVARVCQRQWRLLLGLTWRQDFIIDSLYKARSTLATMSKQRSTLSKGRNFNAKRVRHCCRFWQQSRTLLRHCCWCGPGLRERIALPQLHLSNLSQTQWFVKCSDWLKFFPRWVRSTSATMSKQHSTL